MSFVIAAPEMMTAAAADLATIGSNVSVAHAAAAARTVAVLPAAADEVSVGIAQVFSGHAQDYQAQAVKAAAAQGQFVANLTGSGAAYAGAEDAIHAFLVALAKGNSAVYITAVAQPLSQIAMANGPFSGVALLGVFVGAIPFYINLYILTMISLALTGQSVAWG